MKLLLVQLLGLFALGHSFAVYFTTDEFCERPLEPDSIIMNNFAARSDTRTVLVFRVDGGGERHAMSSGDTYKPGDKFQVDLSDTSDEYVFEVANGVFEGDTAGCEGRRATQGGGLSALSSTAPLVVTAGWAIGHDVVSISEPFTLLPSEAPVAESGTDSGE
jgi:hypothetical protein